MKKTKRPLLWASLLRIIGAIYIFLFHLLAMSHKPTYNFALIGLSIFFFLAGWFGNFGNDKPKIWFWKRLKRILIPYWPVIFVVLIANRIVGYKETTVMKDVLTFLGFSYFLDNPVYIISWFITVILILDFTLFLFKLFRNKFLGYVFLSAMVYFFVSYDPMLKIEVILFYVGFVLGGVKVVDNFNYFSGVTNNAWYQSINNEVYYLQSYTYSFFLVHAAALIFVFHVLKIRSVWAFGVGMFLSVVGAYVHNKLLKRFS